MSARNKYANESREAQRRRQRFQMCERKVGFDTREAAAAHRGQDVYQCRFCAKWHRSGQVAKLAAALTKRHRRLAVA